MLPLITAFLALIGFLPQLVSRFVAPDTVCIALRNCTPEEFRQQQLASMVNTVVSLISLPILLFSIGWNGTQRIWFLRAFRGLGLSRSEGWGFTWRFLGRFLVLGLIVGAVWLPILLVGMVKGVQSAMKGQPLDATTFQDQFLGLVIAMAVATIVVDSSSPS